MEKEKLRAKALKMYAELMVQKIKEVDASDWKKPWFGTDWFGQAQNINGRRYNNFNQILLSFISEEKGYKVPVFLTFNQAKEMGTSVLKGEKGFPVNLYTPIITDKEGNKISMDIYSSLTDAEKRHIQLSRILLSIMYSTLNRLTLKRCSLKHGNTC